MIRNIKNRLYELPPQERAMTLATKITIARGLLIPMLVGCMIAQQWTAAFWVFLGASLTDVLDGGLARFLNEQTILGAALDPIIDKLLVIAVYGTLACIPAPLFHIPAWFFIVVFLKECLLMIGVWVLFYRRGFFRIQPSYLGKGAMVVHVAFITWLFSCYFFKWMPLKTYYVMLGLVLCMTFLSFAHYAYKAIRSLRKGLL